MSTAELPVVSEPQQVANPAEKVQPKDRLASGRAKRKDVPRSAHAKWEPAADRADPIALLEESNKSRLQELVPIRFGRMLASPFTYLRGSPIVMTHDLATTPNAGILTQICGDCHLMNFGLYASPERTLLFDVNDFDETLPGPFEWDLKRLVASFVVAARSVHFKDREGKDAARACVHSYREHMREFSELPMLDVWYSRIDADAVIKIFKKSGNNQVANEIKNVWHRNQMQALSKLTIAENEQLRFIHNPPLIQRLDQPETHEMLQRLFRSYVATLQDDRRSLVARYRYTDFALKVVGVGSVGTRCYIVLLDAGHTADKLLLQVKQAEASILEPYAGKSLHHNHGHRVVSGQRLMQSSSDIFLGWSADGEHDYYFRQLRDVKGSADLEAMSPSDLAEYGALCGWVLARAHARAGDPALISGFLGKGEALDDALADFAIAYADQNDRDYESLQAAAKSGRVPVELGV